MWLDTLNDLVDTADLQAAIRLFSEARGEDLSVQRGKPTFYTLVSPPGRAFRSGSQRAYQSHTTSDRDAHCVLDRNARSLKETLTRIRQ